MHRPDIIRELRRKRKLTQEAAAQRAGISKSQWHNVESNRTGQRNGITVGLLDRIAAALEVRPRDLID
jgi:transcriptional regulator with XRE-family HTH domain